MNKLITCENEIKKDIIDKDLLCFMYQLISDKEDKLKMFKLVRDRNSRMTIENDLMLDELKQQKDFHEKIVNNIKYYKENIRHYTMLFWKKRLKKDLLKKSPK